MLLRWQCAPTVLLANRPKGLQRAIAQKDFVKSVEKVESARLKITAAPEGSARPRWCALC